jgi:two-component system nitrogen regulation response regulator NtrX
MKVTPGMLPREILKGNTDMEIEEEFFHPGEEVPEDFKQARSKFEAWFLEGKLKEHDGNISRLAEAIGLERSYLYRKLKNYDISAD